jgi:hypothetical protein
MSATDGENCRRAEACRSERDVTVGSMIAVLRYGSGFPNAAVRKNVRQSGHSYQLPSRGRLSVPPGPDRPDHAGL